MTQFMSRNRFELLLRTVHFNDNRLETNKTDRLRKIRPLLTMLRERFQDVIIPHQQVCIDETLVPFRGRLRFRQHIKNKRHKISIKLFKLCTRGGFIYDLSVYC